MDAYTSNDAQTVTASFGSEQKTLHDTSPAAWSASYTPPTTTTTGEYQMNLQTSDTLGNTATMTLPYTIYPSGESTTPKQPTTPETTGNQHQPTHPITPRIHKQTAPQNKSSNGYPTASAATTSESSNGSGSSSGGSSTSGSKEESNDTSSNTTFIAELLNILYDFLTIFMEF